MAIKLIGEMWCPHVEDERKEFIVDTDADASALPACCPGSTALVTASGKFYIVNASCQWVEFGTGVVIPTGGSDTLTWDGNTEGLESVNVGSAEAGAVFTLYRISEAAPALADCENGAIVTAADGYSETKSFDEIKQVYDSLGGSGCYPVVSGVFVVPEDDFSVDLGGAIGHFPKKGMWIASVAPYTFPITLTIPGYTGF